MIKRLLATGTVLLLICGVAWSAPDLTGYKVAFIDEFNGDNLDTSLWNTSPLWGPYAVINNEEQYYVDTMNSDQGFSWSPFHLSGGILTIRAVPVAFRSVPPAPPQPPRNDSYWNSNPEFQFNANYNPSNRKYLSGIITSLGSFNFTHGYAEIKAKLPAGQGLWPAFWQLTTKYVEDVPEIDVVELVGDKPHEANHSLHYFNTKNNWELISSPTYKTTGPDFTQDFHTYGLMWEPKKLVYYIDGVPVKTIDESDNLIIAKQAMYLIANLAVGGNWPGSPDSSTSFPAEYKIDYIKVLRKDMPTPVTPAVLNNHYQIMFEDNFNGTSLDAGKWNSSFLWGPYLPINNEEQIYIDKLGRHQNEATNPFTVSNGTLKITAKEVLQPDLPEQEPVTDPVWSNTYPTHQYNSTYNTAGGWVPGYSSGLLTSYDAFKFVHGYAEMRAKIPAGDGLWPAFWLLNGYYVGPQPEIDVMEAKGEEPHIIHHSYHYNNNAGGLVTSADTFTKTSGDYSTGFHTYAVEWDRDYIKWYVDGQVTREITSSEVSKQLMYVIVNLAVGGNFVGPVNAQFPQAYEIDYIRVYQLKNNNSKPPPPAATIVVQDGEWRLVGVPFDTPTGQNTPANLFADDISGIYGQDWDLFGYDAVNKKYFNPGLNGTLVPGAAYWISQATGKSVVLTIPQPSSIPVSQSQLGCETVDCFGYTPPATTGMQLHLVGNPFTDAVNMGDVRVATTDGVCEFGCTLAQAFNANLLRSQFFAFDGKSYITKSGEDGIEGWEGFWMTTLPVAGASDVTVLFSR